MQTYDSTFISPLSLLLPCLYSVLFVCSLFACLLFFLLLFLLSFSFSFSFGLFFFLGVSLFFFPRDILDVFVCFLLVFLFFQPQLHEVLYCFFFLSISVFFFLSFCFFFWSFSFVSIFLKIFFDSFVSVFLFAIYFFFGLSSSFTFSLLGFYFCLFFYFVFIIFVHLGVADFLWVRIRFFVLYFFNQSCPQTYDSGRHACGHYGRYRYVDVIVDIRDQALYIFLHGPESTHKNDQKHIHSHPAIHTPKTMSKTFNSTNLTHSFSCPLPIQYDGGRRPGSLAYAPQECSTSEDFLPRTELIKNICRYVQHILQHFPKTNALSNSLHQSQYPF